jgi:hypothetical protein
LTKPYRFAIIIIEEVKEQTRRQQTMQHTMENINIDINIKFSQELTVSQAEDLAMNSLLEKTRKAVMEQNPELLNQLDADSEDPLEDVVDGLLTGEGPVLEELGQSLITDPETQEAFLDTHAGTFHDHDKDEEWTVYIA